MAVSVLRSSKYNSLSGNPKLFLLFLVSFFSYLPSVSSKDLPTISTSFIVETNEINGKGTEIVSKDGSYETVVVQKIAWDVDARRSNMYAEGSLVEGALQQIKRCDLHPSGWFSNAGGSMVSQPETWSCTNTTITSRGELPWNCAYPNFWAVTDSAIYVGVEEINGISCDKWIYQEDDETEEVYAFWAVENENIPCASGKIKSANNNALFTIFFMNFVAGAPQLSAFEPKNGSVCPSSSPPSISVKDHVTSLQELLVVVESRNKSAFRNKNKITMQKML